MEKEGERGDGGEVVGGYGEGKLVHVYSGDGTLTEKSPRPWGFGKMHCKVLARNDDGNVSIIQVDGRTYLHGSILDQECTKADARIVELERIASRMGIADAHVVSGTPHGRLVGTVGGKNICLVVSLTKSIATQRTLACLKCNIRRAVQAAQSQRDHANGH